MEGHPFVIPSTNSGHAVLMNGGSCDEQGPLFCYPEIAKKQKNGYRRLSKALFLEKPPLFGIIFVLLQRETDSIAKGLLVLFQLNRKV